MTLLRERWLATRHTDRRLVKHRALRYIKGPFRAPAARTRDPGDSVSARRVPKLVRASGPGSYDFEGDILRAFAEQSFAKVVEMFERHIALRGVRPSRSVQGAYNAARLAAVQN